MVTAAVMGVIGAAAREPLAELFTVDEETVATLGPFMLCLALAQPVMQLHFTLAGAFRGAGDTWTPLVAAVLGNWVFRVPLAWAVTVMLDGPLLWIWLVLILDHFTRAAWRSLINGPTTLDLSATLPCLILPARAVKPAMNSS